MKRTFKQKVKPVPTCAADSLEVLLKLPIGKHTVSAAVPTEVNRKARTSAAMIGLAISMGASGLLLPQQGDEALAVEPIAAEPTLTTLPIGTSTPASVPTERQPEVATTATPVQSVPSAPAKPVAEHQVQEGQTLWEVSKSYEVEPEAIAASNKIEPTAVLPVGQKLKIPSANGVVHEVKAGETAKTLSKSYGVEPTQLQTSASVSETSQLEAGESVTVPGKVDDLLKARQNDAIDRLKEKRNRLNDSLAELGSEESTNLSELAKASPSPSATASPSTDALPPVELKSEESATSEAAPAVTVPTTPVVIPVPTPEIAATPTGNSEITSEAPLPIVIPVPTPEIAATPTPRESEAARDFKAPVVIPVPTPEIAATPTGESETGTEARSSVVMPVPSPDTAASLAVEPETPNSPQSVVIPVPSPGTADSSTGEPKLVTIPNSTVESEITAKPPVPQPVVMETLVAASPADTYKVKPGDTVDAIARRYGLSRTELIQANGLNNPNLIRVNQQLTIPTSQPTGSPEQSVTFLPGITNSDTVSLRQEQPGVRASTLVVPTVPNPVAPVVPTEQTSQLQGVSPTVVAQSNDAQTNPTVVVDTKRNASADTAANLYVERLRSDILRMREEYRRQRENGEATASSNIAVPAAPVASVTQNEAASPRTNPEFNPKRYEQQTQQASIPIQVPSPPAAPEQQPQQQLLAVAPAPAEGYNQMLQTPTGQTVAPELPPLSAPDMYLPDSPVPFNGYIWPSKGVLTSGYGQRWGRMHKGIDIAAPVGTPVVAAAPGVVVTAGWNSGGYGKLVEIKHPDGSLTLYAHNHRLLVRSGQEVAQGQQISEMGSTGYSTGPHLHFEVHPAGRGAVNPMAFLPKSR
ncbi:MULTISPECIES: peptidoglycan DD-metalloendopeptidase family protein [unclassified Coleofasciculus]|uniref:peptidoglycan DD-metalloendopeptidase family protein n=1 Tax=unclassified Coleofasciculus TaxID=2692782 RepID=UPI00188193FE|nr:MULTISPECIES: peptidoglycan DD-metalloendopeptidase family protein [unclassified Coleofasciculus]MBE9129068.1 peptidoglycan DD-metalloendopeptidase family protein [Coleofasciculus sp. LEGE 07081]MBE9151933.1 peptidoglycan DD-metalloendopeptidase family protein [Coleofasciculus sp. LEGE 07092]